MRQFITAALLALSLSPFAMGAPEAIYQNPGIVTQAPTVDAVIFDNLGTFEVSTLINLSNITSTAVGFGASPIPYATRDTRYFTNTGTMTGTPGFRFDTGTATTRYSTADVFNSGTIIGQDEEAFADFVATPAGTTALPQYSQPVPSQLLIFATNVINSGELGVGNCGLLQIVAKNFTNQFGSLAAGGLNTGGSALEFESALGFESETDPLDTTGRGSIDSGIGYFVNPPAVYDLVWGATNVTQGTGPSALDLPALSVTLPNVPPMFQGVRGVFGLVGFGGSEVGGALSQYASYIYGFEIDPTNVYWQVVLVNTNFADPNLSANVEFSPEWFNFIPVENFGDGVPPITVVQYSLATKDVLTGDTVTNAIYLIDTGAQLTNAVLYDNSSTANNYDRPFCFELTTATPFEWEEGFSIEQTPFDPALIWTPAAYINNTVPYFASEYEAQIGRNPETLDGTFSLIESLNGTNLNALEEDLFLGEGVELPDPTNEPGRIEITAGQADLTKSRIRAEGAVVLNVTNLIGAGTGASDWGITDASIGETNGDLVLANFFPTNFQRVRGFISAWSATWQNVYTNSVSTNTFHMHVLVVDQSLRGNFKSTIRNLTLNGTKSVNVQNDLTVINRALFDTTNLVLNANVTLTQGAGSFYSANAPTLKALFVNTNASLTVDNVLDIGYNLGAGQVAPNRRHYSISSIANYGSITASAPLFQSAFFTNDGTIVAEDNGSMAINAGQLTLGSPTPYLTNNLVAEGSITLSAVSMQATNSAIVAQDSLILDVTGNLSDGVSGAPTTNGRIINHWQASAGFNLPFKPATGGLFGTEIVTVAGNNTLSDNIWAGADMGASPAGFANNAVIGRLVLDRLTNTATLRFTGAGAQNGLYVDFLELTNYSYSDYREGLIIDPNIKIYFANANADPFKLMEVYPNQLIWVSNFFGPNSTAAVPYINSTNICLMNAALADSTEIGFFGIPNFYRQPYILNDPNDPAIVAPCPSEASAMNLYVTTSANLSTGVAYHSLIVAANGAGTVGPNLTSKELEVGSADTLTATPDKGWTFSGWTINGLGGNPDIQSPVLKFTVGANAIITANFIPNPYGALHGLYNGLFYDPSSTANGAGFFTLTLNTSGAFSGRLLIGPSAYSFSSKLYGSGSQRVQAASGKKSVTVNLQLDTSGASSQLRGDINGGTWDSPLTAFLAPVWTAKNPSPFAGAYTMALLPGGTGMGDSYSAVKVSALGVASVAGSLADGTSFSQSAPVSLTGDWPFYTYAASAQDTVLGWVELGADGPVSTNMTWTKAPGTGRFYPAGFETPLQLIGSPYVAPPKNSPAFSRDLSVTLSGGNLSQDETIALALQKNLSYLSGDVRLTITNTTGVFSGKLGAGQTISGVVLQNQNSARGYFLGTNASGAVLLQGN